MNGHSSRSDRNIDEFKRGILELVPILRGFALSLAGVIGADDLVQETVMRAIANRKHFQEGTNLAAWLLTITRNLHYNQYRKTKRVVSLFDVSNFEDLQYVYHDEGVYSDARQALLALDKLTPIHKEVLIDVGGGMSVSEMAEKYNVAEGTIKSRINRARTYLRQLTG